MVVTRKTWLTVAALALTAGLTWWWRSQGPKDPKSQFVTSVAERGNVLGKVTASGTLSPLVTVQVGTQVSGRIQSLFVDFNSPVKKGQMLAKIDPELLNAALAQARSNEQAAQGNLAKAKAQAADGERKLSRAKLLSEQKLIAPAEFEAALAESEVAKASIMAAEGSLAQARAQRQQAEVNLGYTTIISPIDGVVISRNIDVGQTVAASLSAPTLFTIAETLSRMQVDTNVAEADVGKLKENLDAVFSVDAFAGRPFRGRIRQIRFAPQVVQNIVTYDAVIDVDNPDLLLRPGMTANVSFVFAKSDNVIRVPNAALRFRLEPVAGQAGGNGGFRARGGDAGVPGGRTVYVMRGDKPEAVQVQTGLTDGVNTEVLSGLAEGEVVVVDRQGEASKPSGQNIGGQNNMGGLRRAF